ncbi:hypothetical protein DFO70_1122 [Cytobacillus firmus]|uniref:ISXO2-like transposase domain-containing protein n=2 Tax=Cytobacillus TaxID=2675230 RepID=A0A366JP32_CYTFI|nr:hypothetical protein DFO70_1122 [Cytobacillus firmus]TDX47176.1 hypothetical protein DFO72_101264 [Cytobacillus oceanisediminis]
MDETYFLFKKKGYAMWKVEKFVNEEAFLRSEAKTKSKYVSSLQGTARNQLTQKWLVRGEIVKIRLEEAIGSKLSPSNVLCTDAWRAFMTYAKEKGT